MGTCRLCLKSLCGSPVIALESSMRTSINFVLPEINLDISTTPAVCKACCDIIQSLYQFKVNCIEIEEKIRAKTSGGYVKLNLKEIFSNLLTKKKEERLCRTCLCSIDCQSFTVLQPSEPDPYLDSMLIMCLPELDMELCRDPVMCQKCLDSLQKLYNLKTTCLEVEEKLKNYHFAQGTNIDAQINLQEAMESFSNETGLVNIKKEAEIDLVDEKYPDDATQAIKEEEIDIKEESIADKEPKVLRSVKCNKNLETDTGMESLDVKVFISEVQRRPVIWDAGYSEYTNKEKKKSAWEEMVNIFIGKEGATVNEKRYFGQQLHRRWKSLRDSYAREVRLQKQTKSGGGPRKRPIYVYFKQLSFLETAVATQPLPNSHDQHLSPTLQRSTYLVSKRKKQYPAGKRLVNAIKKNVQQRPEREREAESDCDRMFLLSLLKPLQQIPEHARFGVKRKLMELLDSELQDYQQTLSTNINPPQHQIRQTNSSSTSTSVNTQRPSSSHPNTSSFNTNVIQYTSNHQELRHKN